MHYSFVPIAESITATINQIMEDLQMKRGTLLVGTAIVLSLAGCAQPMVWNKYGATNADYQQDSYACEKDARQSGYFGTGIAGAVNMRNFFKHCMVAHGWTLQS